MSLKLLRQCFVCRNTVDPNIGMLPHLLRTRSTARSSMIQASLKCYSSMTESNNLFNYTSGRWMYNESHRLSERHLTFDVAQLNRIAAASIGRPEGDVSSIRKLAEGGFNRVFEITMRNGDQVLARLPYPFTKPKHYATANEVATMDFVRLHGVPVPRVFAYSLTDENPVGSEYIIMEKVRGRELRDLWSTMPEEQRLKMIFKIVQLEALLFSINLPASGSIFYQHDLSPGQRNMELQLAGGNGTFCVGPDAHYKWWYKERQHVSAERGPFSEAGDVLESAAKRELAWLENFGRARLPFQHLHRELFDYQKVEPAEHIRNLHDYLRIARLLAPETSSFLNRPILRHPDLRPSNVLVSDSFEVVALIDWQHCSILPLFLQAGPPDHFQNYGDEVSESLVKPQLPSDFSQLEKDEQEAAQHILEKRQLHFYYFAATAKYNKEHLRACMEEGVVFKQKLFQHASDRWKGDSVTLRADLVRAIQSWQGLVAGKQCDCPLEYSPTEVEECLNLESEQQLSDEDLEKSRNFLGVSIDGWVPEDNFERANYLSEKFKDEAIGLAESEEVAMQIRQHWPFDDHNEDE